MLKIFALTACGYALFLLSANICQATFSGQEKVVLKIFQELEDQGLGIRVDKGALKLVSCRALPFCCHAEPVEGSQRYSAGDILDALQ